MNNLQPERKRTKLPVELVSHSAQTVTVPAKERVCDLYSTEDVITLEQGSSPGKQEASNNDRGNGSFLLTL